MDEQWVSVVGYEGIYEVSSLGRLRNSRGKILRQEKTWAGYLRFKLQRNRVTKRRQVHCLVAEAFLGPCPPLHEVNHKNRVRGENHVGNLEYLTKSANIKHGFDALGGNPKTDGSQHWNHKLVEAEVIAIRAKRSVTPLNQLASEFGVSMSTISMICNRRTWTHI